ncbi:MAG TPA: c-type cytochrome [Steroidobacteraceae bacterium]
MSILRAGRWRVLVAGITLTLGLALSPGLRAASPPRPTEFDICQGCHGVFAQGNAELGAPRIAGLDPQYIGRQLADFRDGRRGSADAFGGQMTTIASTLDDTAIGRLSAYVGSMPEVQVTPTLGGNAKSGQATYVTCAACHGANGEGGVSLGAPRLAGMSDWYLLRQIGHFASGKRGSAPGDERGVAMRGIAATLASEQAVRDVLTYAVSLQLPPAVASAACADRVAGACGSSR